MPRRTAGLLLAAWSMAAQAGESEVGREQRFGIGVAAGFPSSFTVKVHARPTVGVALHVGPTLVTGGLHLRLQAEHSAARLRASNLGELRLGWQAGLVVDLLFGGLDRDTAVRPGILVGVGGEFRLVPLPVGLFAEVSPVLYPFDIAPGRATPYQPLGLVVAIGGRWHL